MDFSKNLSIVSHEALRQEDTTRKGRVYGSCFSSKSIMDVTKQRIHKKLLKNNFFSPFYGGVQLF